MSVYTVILANTGKEGLYLVYLYGGQKAFCCLQNVLYISFTIILQAGVRKE